MKSVIAVAALAALASAWSPPDGTWTKEGSWGTSTAAWGHGPQKTWTPTAWSSAPTSHPAWNSSMPIVGPTGTQVMSTGAGVYPSTGSPIATGGVDNSKPLIGGLLAIAGAIAAL